MSSRTKGRKSFLLVLLFALVQLLPHTSCSSSPSIYWSMFKPNGVRTITGEDSEIYDTTDFGKLKSVVTFEVDIKDLDMDLDKFISRALGKDVVLVRFPSNLFGWHSYEFMGEVDAGCYDIRTVQNKKKCRVLLSCEVNKKGVAICHIQVSSKGLKGGHVKVISKEMTSRIKSSIEQTAHTIKSRRKVIKAESGKKKKARSEAIKQKKKKALDKLLHPEKYKTPSPTVRKEGGLGYNPYMPELGRGTHERRGSGSMSAIKAAEARKPKRG